MPTNYPGALDVLTNPTSTDTQASPSHAAQHANANDAIEAIQARLGAGNSVGTHTVIATDYGLSSAATAAANQTALQAAIVAAENAGKKLIIPAATDPYMLAGTVNISKPLTIEGEGWDSELQLANSANAYIFTMAPVGVDFIGGATIRDLYLNCNGANQTTGGGGIIGWGVVYCRFDHLQIRRPWNNGILLRDDAVGNDGHHNVIFDCFFENGDQSNGGDGRGVRLDASDENTTESCTFQGMGRTGAGEPNAYFDLAGLNTIEGCTFVTGETGVKIQGSHSRVIGNTFDGCRNHHVRLNGAKNTVADNTFFNIGYDEPVVANTIDGLWVDNVAANTIASNVFVSHSGGGARSGVNLSSGPATDTVVVGNQFSILDGAAWGTEAIIRGSGTGHIIHSNPGATKPVVSGSRGGNAALADLLTELATAGLITDSSSA